MLTATDPEQWQRLSLSEAAHWPMLSITYRRRGEERRGEERRGEERRGEGERAGEESDDRTLALRRKEHRGWNLRRDHMGEWGERWWERGRAGWSKMDSERTTGKRRNEGEESRNETEESRDLRRQERRGEERKEDEIFFFFLREMWEQILM